MKSPARNDDDLAKLENLLRQVEPARCNQSFWIHSRWLGDPKTFDALRRNDCGTQACAGGYSALLFPDRLALRILDSSRALLHLVDRPGVVGFCALRDMFGLTQSEASHIFGAERSCGGPTDAANRIAEVRADKLR